MRKVAEMEVARGTEKRKVQLLEVIGLGLAPEFVWTTTDAEPRLFADIYPGYSQLIEEGWNSNADALEARQVQAEGEALVDLQKRVAHPLGSTTLIRNARVFDSEKAVLTPASDVMVRDGRIVSVIGTGAPTKADNVIEAGGRVLLPGLFDMHGHLDPWEGGLNIAAGVTTVRDMGNDNATLQRMIEQERAGTLLSTRIVPAGFIEGVSDNSGACRLRRRESRRGEERCRLVRRARLSADQDLQLVSKGHPARHDCVCTCQGAARERSRTGVPARAGRRRAGL
jgi:hypothetical protein